MKAHQSNDSVFLEEIERLKDLFFKHGIGKSSVKDRGTATAGERWILKCIIQTIQK